jgi:FMN-dependent NADH-azoreductase
MKLLHIDSSILSQASVSRTLSADLVEVQRRVHPDIEVVYRDLGTNPLQHLSGAHLAAAQGAVPAAGLDLEASAIALEEFLAADIIVIGAPMYNFTISSQLKSWIDRLAVAGKTFRYSEKGPEGLAGGKKVHVASSRGGVYTVGPAASFDHQETYLSTFLGFLGITDIAFFRAEGVARPGMREQSIEAARAQIQLGVPA